MESVCGKNYLNRSFLNSSILKIIVNLIYVRSVVLGFKSIFLRKETARVFRKLTKRNNIDYFVCVVDGCTAKLRSEVGSESFIGYGGNHTETVDEANNFIRVQQLNKLVKEWSIGSECDNLSASDLYAKAKAVFKGVELPHDHRSKQLTSIRQNRFKLRKNGLSNKCESNVTTVTPRNVEKTDNPKEVIATKSTSKREIESKCNSQKPKTKDGEKIPELATPIAKRDSIMTPRKTRIRTISKATPRNSGKIETPEELNDMQRGAKPKFYSPSTKTDSIYDRLRKVKRKLTYE